MSFFPEANRARSLPHRNVYYLAVFAALFHYLCVVATLTLVVLLVRNPSQQILEPLLAGVVMCVVTWFFAFFKRRSARCPLCQGTPLLDSAASKHSKARRIAFLNYGTSAVLSTLACHRFRCMYCGTPYDLLKKSGSSRSGYQDTNG